MNSDKPLRVFVAGLGNMGRSHALAYHNNPGFEIVSLVNRQSSATIQSAAPSTKRLPS
jgi:predicted dehydrogenase